MKFELSRRSISFRAGLFLLVNFFCVFLLSCGNSGEVSDPEAYRKELLEQRKGKDEFYRTSAESPITDKQSFRGLAYFEPDPAFRVSARLEPFADKTQRLAIPMSDGSEDVYTKYAHAVFSLQGEVCRVLLLKHGDTISLLFRDQTSGKETYGGGRYLDFKEDEVRNNQLTIDFNAAYHPYCAFNHEYACPLPPKENTLPVAVKAGERLK